MNTPNIDNKPSLRLTDGHKITLTQMLSARDTRMQQQQRWLNQYKNTLISLTMVIPGDIKNSSGSRFLFETSLKQIHIGLQKANQKIIAQECFSSDAGLEALMAIESDAVSIKQLCMMIEQTHPLGRYWDIDVICPQQGILSRPQQNINQRKCFVCDNNAHLCTRSQAHTISELIAAIEEKINTFHDHNE